MLFCPKQVFCKCVTHCENGKFRSTMADIRWFRSALRSEEHTSELQSPCNLVCRLLLEKKKIQSHRLHVVAPRIIDKYSASLQVPSVSVIKELLRAHMPRTNLTSSEHHMVYRPSLVTYY